LADKESVAGSEPGAEGRTVLVCDSDAAGRPVISTELLQQVREQRCDLCVISYDDRFGVRLWRWRLLPIRAGIPGVVAINCRGAARSYRWSTWVLSTLVACSALRLAQPLVRFLRNALDNSVIAMLTVLACGAAVLRAAGLHPLGRHLAERPKSSLRLFIFIPSFGLGGAQTVLIDLLRSMDRRKCEVSVCTLDEPDKFFEPAVRQMGVSLTYLSCPRGFPPYWKIIWALTRRLYDERPDAAIGWHPWATVFTAIAASLVGVPRVFQSIQSQSPARLPAYLPVWQRPLEMLTARLVDRVIACSEACREDYMRWGRIPSRKIVTVHNGVDLARVRRPPEAELRAVRASLQVEGRPLVGIVGRLSAEKDHQTFLEAMRLVHRAVPSVAAIIIGKGPDERALRKATERLGLGRVVTFLGAPAEIMALLASLDVLVLSSRTEGLPTVLLEGQALGVPVVTTDAGGARETVREGETGFIVPCGDSQQLAARMIQLLQDEPLRRRLGRNGQSHVLERFTAERMATEILRASESGRGTVAVRAADSAGLGSRKA